MSLINEALKKAQRDRTSSDSAAVPTPGGGPAPARSGKRTPSLRIVLLTVVGGAVLVGGSIFGTVYLLRKPVSSISIQAEARALPPQSDTGERSTAPISAPSLAKAADAEINTRPAVEQPPKQVEQMAEAKAKPMSEAKETSPAAAATTKALAPAGKKLIELPSVATVAAAPSPTASNTGQPTRVSPPTGPLPEASMGEQKPEQPAANKAPPSAAAQTFVNQLKVNGIRASGADSKVLINDRVYRIGDLIDTVLALKLAEVTPERLVFIDAAGNQYARNF